MSCQTKLDKYIFKTPKFEIAPLIGCTESFSQPLCPHRGGYPLYKTIGFLEPNDPDFIQLIPRGMNFPSHPKTPPPQKKTREFPPIGRPSPCGKTGLAPCRQCTFSIFLHSFFGYFSHLFFICLFILCFSLFFLFMYLFFFFLCRSHWVSYHIPKRQKTSNTQKYKLQNQDQKTSKRVCPTRVCPTRVSAHPSAQQLRPQRFKHLNPLLPLILMKKLGCLPQIFNLSSKPRCFFCVVHWISHHSPKRPPKKSREFPLGGPSPCGKTGLAPCRQCTFSIYLHSFFGYFFSFVFYLYIHSMFFLFSLFIYFFSVPGRSLDFPSHPKTPKKNSREFPLGGPFPLW